RRSVYKIRSTLRIFSGLCSRIRLVSTWHATMWPTVNSYGDDSMPIRLTRIALAAVVFIGATGAVSSAVPDGPALYAQRCARCHDHAQGHMPTRESLASRPLINIVMTLKTGSMQPQAEGLSQAEVTAIAAFLSAAAVKPVLHPNTCSTQAQPLRVAQ